MAGRTRFLLLFLVLLVSGGPVAAQLIDTTTFIRGLFRDYLAREPSAEELSAWVRSMQRGTPASEVHAYLLASDECFARYGRDVPAWINAAYGVVVGRPPTPRDIVFWTGKLNSLRGDRLTWAREFLRGADWQAPSFPRPPVAPPTADLPTRLVTTCQLLTQSIQTELPGGRGWLAQTQANNLLTSAEANRFVLGNPVNNPVAFVQALTSLQTANDALRSTLAQIAPAAPTSRQYADQVYQLLVAIRNTVPSPVPLPPLPPGPLPPTPLPPGGIDQDSCDEFLRRTEEVHRLAHRFEEALRIAYPRDWVVERLLRDAEEFHGDLDRFKVQVRVGAPRAELRATLQRLRSKADRISEQVRQGSVDRRLVQAWYDTGLAFNALLDYAGVTAEPVDPWAPVPWSAGAGGLPVNLGGAAGPSPAQAGLRALDDAIAQCDSLSAALTPYTLQSPAVVSLQNGLRDLRNSLLGLRRAVQQGASRGEVAQLVSNVGEDARRVESLWNRLGQAARDLPDPAALRLAVQRATDPNFFPFQP